MAYIEAIKQRILQLDAGAFQSLCDVYLSRVGYAGIVSLGTQAGTRKTTKGTPDAYFTTPEGKYIFVEYTTQQEGVFKKILDDLKKCLDETKTGVNYNDISEIIYCHTSSNISPRQDKEAKELCSDKGIKLTFIGIDKLAEDLYRMHSGVVRDFLGISIDSGQIQSHNDFIKRYNSNRMAAPIDTEFLFREREIESIGEAYQITDVVVLNGAAGTGKTRLALHYAEIHAKVHNEKFYCIHSNALSIYEDLKIFINEPGNYFLLIDDANQLSELKHIIHYTTMKPEGYNVKVLITVRNYAFQKVKNDLMAIASYKAIDINAFTDNEISTLLEATLGITNPNYHERIKIIAEGNARIAIFAGKVAYNSNRLDSIKDVSQLYEEYYGSLLEENQLLNDTSLCVVAGIVAFLEAIHIEKMDWVLPILQEKGLSRDTFIESIYELHDREIVDIFNDAAVRISEQSLANYLLKFVFCDKKLISLSEMVKTCFQRNKEQAISSINTLLNIFRNEDVVAFVETEIKTLWDELLQENASYFLEFVKVFFRVNPTETLLILKNKIELEDSVVFEISDINTEKGKNYQSVTNDIIEVLGGFADMEDLQAALDLFFKYYLKRPDLYMQFYHTINRSFGVKTASVQYYDFYTQIRFFEKIKEYSCDWTQEFIVALFLEVAKEFLKLHFTPAEGGRKNTVTFYQISLTISNGVEKYRDLIWQGISILCKMERYKDNVRLILNSYGKAVEDSSVLVMKFDLPYINSILETAFPPLELQNCILAYHLMRTFTSMNITCDFDKYFEEEHFHIYQLLEGRSFEIGVDWQEREKMKHYAIEEYVSQCNFSTFKKILLVCTDVNMQNSTIAWSVGEGLQIVFDTILIKKDYYVDAIKYYIEKDTPFNLYPLQLLKPLFSMLSDSDIYCMINECDFNQKNLWIYAYYCELPSELITENHLQDLFNFLSDNSDKNIISSKLRDVTFLEKYNIIDEDAFVKGCTIILSKMQYTPFMVDIYFNMLFNRYHNTPQTIIKKFGNNLELLEEIYCALLEYGSGHDYDGKFLKEIYIVQPSILKKYILWLFGENSNLFNRENNEYMSFFEHENFIEIFDTIFEGAIKNCRLFATQIHRFLENLLSTTQNKEDLLEKQDKWIRHSIKQFFGDNIKMKYLFSAISQLDEDRRIEYIWLFLDINPSFEAFEKIPLTLLRGGWEGTIVPNYIKQIKFLESLLPGFVGSKWIEHKNHVEKNIERLKNAIKFEEVDNILRG